MRLQTGVHYELILLYMTEKKSDITFSTGLDKQNFTA